MRNVNTDNIYMQSIQHRLRQTIQESGKNQHEIAKALNVTDQTVSKYMNENIFPALDTLARLCAYLDVSADYILGLKEY